MSLMIGGGFERSAAGARGVVNTAYTSCTRFRVLTTLGIDTREVAKKFYGLDVAGQSPFAFETGLRFEAALTAVGAKYLLEQYHRVGRIARDRGSIRDLTESPNPLGATLDLIRRRARGDTTTPDLIWQGALQSPIPGELVRPDLLVAGSNDRYYRPGEVKSYEDRGAQTNEADIDSAASQAAVSLVSLRAIADIAYPRDFMLVDLILRSPSGMLPRLRTVSVERDIAILEDSLAAFPLTQAHVESVLQNLGVEAIDSAENLEAIPHRYQPGCRSHCSLSDACKARATANGELSRFGAAVAEAMAPFRTEAEIEAAIAAGSKSPTLAHYQAGLAALESLIA